MAAATTLSTPQDQVCMKSLRVAIVYSYPVMLGGGTDAPSCRGKWTGSNGSA